MVQWNGCVPFVKNRRQMWQIWEKSKHYRCPPNEIFPDHLYDFCEEITGLPGRDDLSIYQFNTAVEYFGRYIEAHLLKMEDGKALYTLSDFLDGTSKKIPAAIPSSGKIVTSRNTISHLASHWGIHEVSVDTLLSDPAYIKQIEDGLVKPPPGYKRAN